MTRPGSLALLLPILVPTAVAAFCFGSGWGRAAKWASLLSPLAIGASGALVFAATRRSPLALGGSLLWGDGLSAFMLFVTAIVSLLAVLASSSYIQDEILSNNCSPARARNYIVLFHLFLAAMSGAIMTDNLGVIWVAIEATTISTAFLVAHKNTSKALEAAWKYVIICSFGITLAFFGTVLIYFSAIHAGVTSADALSIHVLLGVAPHMNNTATRLGLGFLLLGYGAKVGLVPFHTWLADAHSQAPAPVSALMSGVLLSVAFSVLLRIKVLADQSVGMGFFRVGLIAMGLGTMVVAALLMVGQRDFKRLFAYSSLENMGLVAVAAGVGSRLALVGLLLHIFAHGVSKSLVFISSGQLQSRIHTTEISDVRALARDSPVLGYGLAIGSIGLIGFPPFALFASETAIAVGIGSSKFAWVLIIVVIAILVASSSIAKHVLTMLFGPSNDKAPRIAVTAAERLPLVMAVSVGLYIGVFANPIMTTVARAGTVIGIGK